jgi:hypothetical protein
MNRVALLHSGAAMNFFVRHFSYRKLVANANVSQRKLHAERGFKVKETAVCREMPVRRASSRSV